ncbi:uncharacterized protein TRAVEDRAFT_84308, partial [Trametes versicolor FP-101664 SS1]
GYGFHERGPVVGHDLGESAPSTEDILEDEIRDSLRVFDSEHPPLDVERERASGLDDHLEAVRDGEQHRVYVDSSEKTGGERDRRGQQDLADLTGLANV